MKTLKKIAFVFSIFSILSLSACEIIEEPVFEETTETGEEIKKTETND